MAINVLRGKIRRGDPLPHAIGEVDANVFSCPNCARPLVAGARRCPGCRAHLVMGIQIGRAALFLSLGIALGALAGGGAVAVTVQDRLAGLTAAAPVAAPRATDAVAAPITDPNGGTTTDPVRQPAGLVIPAAAVWSLTQTAIISARLADAGAALGAAVSLGDTDAAAIATALRTISSDAASGVDLAARLGAWPSANGLAADLHAFYAEARTIARAGLAASVSNEPAYRDAAIRMIGILGSLGTLDERSRSLADSAGVTLVPVSLPAATDAAGPTGPGPEPVP